MTVPRPGGACVIELPAGHLDDPPAQAGLAALLVESLADPRCGGAPARAADEGWLTRHQVADRHASLAYWSPDPADLRQILTLVRRTRLPDGPAGEAVLAELRARRSATLEGRGMPLLALVRRHLEGAAWGTPPPGHLATPRSLAAVTPAALAQAAELLLSQARVHRYSDQDDVAATPPAHSHVTPRWHGGLDIARHPGSDARVAVRLPVADTASEVLELFTEVLGNGTDGRLHRDLRHRNHLAYGFTATCWHDPGSFSIGATATVAPEHAAAALRVLTAALRRLAKGAGHDETHRARRRCRAALLTELDRPFGLVDEARRIARGQPPLPVRLAAMARIGELPGLTFAPLPPAVAAVGPFTEDHMRHLAEAHQDIQ
ncbi:insulinase family protein [Streptomyces sp. NPDC058486]|uniref:insulinase family protein n=1 Tax=unclassified Streptomyces TaxID=2593676 RepID=UPI0036535406